MPLFSLLLLIRYLIIFCNNCTSKIQCTKDDNFIVHFYRKIIICICKKCRSYLINQPRPVLIQSISYLYTKCHPNLLTCNCWRNNKHRHSTHKLSYFLKNNISVILLFVQAQYIKYHLRYQLDPSFFPRCKYEYFLLFLLETKFARKITLKLHIATRATKLIYFRSSNPHLKLFVTVNVENFLEKSKEFLAVSFSETKFLIVWLFYLQYSSCESNVCFRRLFIWNRVRFVFNMLN